ncbi:MAG: tetratricopeptide repeat protein [Deltaproteobacteria bacterium]
MQLLWDWFLEPANQQLCLTVLVSLLLGVLAGRLLSYRSEKRVRFLRKESDKAFLKGIQYILSNDHDQAIEEFTKSVQINSDTIETYVALGNLYRSKGDIDRAIRIRQSIILRPNIDDVSKLRALIDLGLDYRKGGFMNRALEALNQALQKEPANLEALDTAEKIYEDMRDWENAYATRQKIARVSKGDHKHILAHYQVELGKESQEKGDLAKAKSCFQKAISIDEICLDAHLHLGDLHFQKQDYKKAVSEWRKVVRLAPQFSFLAYRRLEGAYGEMKNLKPVEDFLKECAQSSQDAFTHMALSRYLFNELHYQGAVRELNSALELDPSFWEARKFKGEILLGRDMKDEALSAYRDLILRLNVPYLKFQCSHCGFRPGDLQWQCPQCRRWDTIGLMDSAEVAEGPASPRTRPEERP